MKIFGKSIATFYAAISNALDKKVVMWATPKGNVAIIAWEEYERLKENSN